MANTTSSHLQFQHWELVIIWCIFQIHMWRSGCCTRARNWRNKRRRQNRERRSRSSTSHLYLMFRSNKSDGQRCPLLWWTMIISDRMNWLAALSLAAKVGPMKWNIGTRCLHGHEFPSNVGTYSKISTDAWNVHWNGAFTVMVLCQFPVFVNSSYRND